MKKVNAKDVIQQRIGIDGIYQINVDWIDAEYMLDRYFERYDLQLNPDFQRGHVWTQAQQIAYVEFIMAGGYNGKDIYFNCPGWGDDTSNQTMVCVDGLQRLTAVREFLKNKFKILNKYHADNFTMISRHCEFLFNINGLKNKANVLQWYLEMNSGGTPHSKEEIQRVRDLLDTEEAK